MPRGPSRCRRVGRDLSPPGRAERGPATPSQPPGRGRRDLLRRAARSSPTITVPTTSPAAGPHWARSECSTRSTCCVRPFPWARSRLRMRQRSPTTWRLPAVRSGLSIATHEGPTTSSDNDDCAWPAGAYSAGVSSGRARQVGPLGVMVAMRTSAGSQASEAGPGGGAIVELNSGAGAGAGGLPRAAAPGPSGKAKWRSRRSGGRVRRSAHSTTTMPPLSNSSARARSSASASRRGGRHRCGGSAAARHRCGGRISRAGDGCQPSGRWTVGTRIESGAGSSSAR